MKKKLVITKKSSSSGAHRIDSRPAKEPVHPQLITRKLTPPPPRIVSTREAIEHAKQKEPTTFKFYCIRCGQKLQVQTTWAGRDVNCSTCSNKITIPEPLS